MKNRQTVAKKKADCIFCIVTICLVLILIGCISVTAYSKEAVENAKIEAYYQGLEKEMVKEVRIYLNDNGYRNSGVTLTRVVAVNAKRQYTLTVHHDKIDRMDETQRQELDTELGQFGFDYNNCEFQRDFLLN